MPTIKVKLKVGRRLWVVIGSSGEYEDYRTWNVAAFRTEDAAKRRAALAKAEADRLERLYKESQAWSQVNKFDRCMQCSYTGVEYCVTDLELLEE